MIPCYRGQQDASKSIKPGLLRLSIHVSEGSSLSVHIHQIKDLRSCDADVYKAHVQVALCPSDGLSSHWTTRTVTSQDDTVEFNDKLDITLAPGDETKRLWLCVRHENAKKVEFLGAMSFGVKHLMNKNKQPVSGWYHLLSESVSHRKHLVYERAAICTPTVTQTETSRCATDTATDTTKSKHGACEKRLEGLDRISLTVCRSGSGFGFTVKNTCPARVGSVKALGPAHRAGLQKGDYVISVNGRDVTRSTAGGVVNHVRQTLKYLSLDICRKPSKSQTQQTNTTRRIDQSALASENIENIPPQKCDVISVSRTLGDQSSPKSRSSEANERIQEHNHRENVVTPNKWDPYISNIFDVKDYPSRRCVSEESLYGSNDPASDESVYHRHYVSMASFNDTSSSWQRTELTRDRGFHQSQSHMTSDENCRDSDSAFHGSQCSQYDVTDMSDDVIFRDNSFDSAQTQKIFGYTNHYDHSVLDAIVTYEREFTSFMQRGIQQYSRPLRHCVLTPEHHQLLFQNVEKLVALSEYHLRQMTTRDDSCHGYRSGHRSNDPFGVEDRSVTHVYMPKIDFLIAAYNNYIDGLPAAFGVLQELHTNQEFSRFLKTQDSSGITLLEFLSRPKRHLANLMDTLPKMDAINK